MKWGSCHDVYDFKPHSQPHTQTHGGGEADEAGEADDETHSTHGSYGGSSHGGSHDSHGSHGSSFKRDYEAKLTSYLEDVVKLGDLRKQKEKIEYLLADSINHQNWKSLARCIVRERMYREKVYALRRTLDAIYNTWPVLREETMPKVPENYIPVTTETVEEILRAMPPVPSEPVGPPGRRRKAEEDMETLFRRLSALGVWRSGVDVSPADIVTEAEKDMTAEMFHYNMDLDDRSLTSLLKLAQMSGRSALDILVSLNTQDSVLQLNHPLATGLTVRERGKLCERNVAALKEHHASLRRQFEEVQRILERAGDHGPAGTLDLHAFARREWAHILNGRPPPARSALGDIEFAAHRIFVEIDDLVHGAGAVDVSTAADVHSKWQEALKRKEAVNLEIAKADAEVKDLAKAVAQAMVENAAGQADPTMRERHAYFKWQTRRISRFWEVLQTDWRRYVARWEAFPGHRNPTEAGKRKAAALRDLIRADRMYAEAGVADATGAAGILNAYEAYKALPSIKDFNVPDEHDFSNQINEVRNALADDDDDHKRYLKRREEHERELAANRKRDQELKRDEITLVAQTTQKQKKIKDYNNRVDEKNVEAEARETDVHDKEAQIEHAMNVEKDLAAALALQEELRAARDARDLALSEAEANRKEAEKLADDLKDKEEQLQAVMRERARLRRAVELTADVQDGMKFKITRQRQVIANKNEQLLNLRQKMSEATARADLLKTQLAAATALSLEERRAMEAEVMTLTGDLGAATDKTSRMHREITSLREHVKGLDRANKELRDTFHKTNKKIRTLREKKNVLAKQKQDLTIRMHNMEAAHAAALKTRVDETEEMRQEHENRMASLRQAIQAKEDAASAAEDQARMWEDKFLRADQQLSAERVVAAQLKESLNDATARIDNLVELQRTTGVTHAEELAEALRSKRELEEELSTYTADLEKMRVANTTLQSALDEARGQAETAAAEVRRQQVHIDRLKAAEQAKEQTVRELKETNITLQNAIRTHKSNAETASHLIADLEATVAENAAKIDQGTQEAARLRDELGDAMRSLRDLEAQRTADARTAAAEAERLNNLLVDAQERSEAQKRDLESQRQASARLQTQADDLRAQIDAGQQRLRASTDDNTQLRNRLAAQTRQLEDVHLALSQAEADVRNLEEQHLTDTLALERELAEVRTNAEVVAQELDAQKEAHTRLQQENEAKDIANQQLLEIQNGLRDALETNLQNLQRTRDANTALSDELQKQLTDIARKDAQVERLRARLEVAGEKLEAAHLASEQERVAATLAVANLERELRALRQSAQATETQLADNRDQLEGIRQTNTSLQGRLRAQEATIAENVTEMQTLQDALQTADRNLNDLQTRHDTEMKRAASVLETLKAGHSLEVAELQRQLRENTTRNEATERELLAQRERYAELHRTSVAQLETIQGMMETDTQLRAQIVLGNQQLVEAQQANARMDAINTAQAEVLAQRDAEVRALQGSLQAAQERGAHIQSQAALREAQLERLLEQERGAHATEVHAYQERLAGVESQLQTAQETAKDLETRLVAENTRARSLEGQVAEHRNTLNALGTINSQINGTILDINKQLGVTQQDLNAHKQGIQDLRTQLDYERHKVHEAETDRDKALAQLIEADTMLTQGRAEMQDLQRQMHEGEAVRQDEIRALAGQLREMEAQRQQLEQEYREYSAAATRENDNLRARLEQVENQVKNQAAQIAAQAEELRRAHQAGRDVRDELKRTRHEAAKVAATNAALFQQKRQLIEQHRQDLASAAGELASAKTTIAELQDNSRREKETIKRLQAQEQDLANRLHKSEEEVAERDATIGLLHERIAALNARGDLDTAERTRLQEELLDANQHNVTLTERMHELTAERDRHKDQQERIALRLGQLEHDATAEVNRLTQALAHSQTVITRNDTQIVALNKELTEFKERYSVEATKTAGLEDALLTRDADIGRLQHTVETLTAIIDATRASLEVQDPTRETLPQNAAEVVANLKNRVAVLEKQLADCLKKRKRTGLENEVQGLLGKRKLRPRPRPTR